jgi:preprotein translocase subunit SecY
MAGFGVIKTLTQDKDLRKKIFIVVGLLLVFRLMASLPIPGANQEQLRLFFEQNQYLGLVNVFSGGALANFSLAMLGVGPYINATIILQLLTLIFPSFKEMYYEEGEMGRAKFNQYARYLTVVLGLLQAFGLLNLLRANGIVSPLSVFDTIRHITLVTAGSMFLMWLGELISEQKIGNGISLLIFAGIITDIPMALYKNIATFDVSKIPAYLLFLGIALITLAGVVIINESERRIPVNYAKRVRGMKIYGGATSYLPLKVNQAGVIPIIFALSLLMLPGMLGQVFSGSQNPTLLNIAIQIQNLTNNRLIYGLSYFVLVFAFTYFYTVITFEPHELANNLQKQGGFIPGIRPGETTSKFLSQTLYRITFLGALFLAIIAILPIAIQGITGMTTLSLGGTSLLIVVSVALETIRQIRAQLVMREYDTF